MQKKANYNGVVSGNPENWKSGKNLCDPIKVSKED
jgi:hypothetical protein